jgi:hypothetical protein
MKVELLTTKKNKLPLFPDIAIDTKAEITTLALWIIAGSYFVIDFIYPLSFLLLVDLFARNVLRSVTATMVKECGVDQYEDTFKKKIF